ncbi:hypothetical protein [Dietzia sp.]|uniref:hypothetical protein n=1 Tax=Dietzia sp. TaxID=1871616 RepID=UPI002FDB7BB9
MPFRLAFRDHNVVVFTLHEAAERGYSRAAVDEKVTKNQWSRVCRGAFATTPLSRFYREERHVISVAGALVVSEPEWRASSWSALAVHGLPLVGHDLRRVHLSRHAEKFAFRSYDTRIKIECPLGPEDLGEAQDIPTVSPASALAQFARQASFKSAVVALDASLHRKLISREAVGERLQLRGGNGLPRARAAVDFADARSESPGESILRVLLFLHGFPTPIPQYCIHDGEGPTIYVADLYRAEGNLILEFDGKGKFDSSENPPSSYTQFDRQRDRDYGLVTRGYRDMHVTWSDLRDEALLIARIRKLLEVAA